MFIHDALCELIVCGDTEIAAPSLRMTINHLHKQAEGKMVSGFEHQFQVRLELQDSTSFALILGVTMFGSIVS